MIQNMIDLIMIVDHLDVDIFLNQVMKDACTLKIYFHYITFIRLLYKTNPNNCVFMTV